MKTIGGRSLLGHVVVTVVVACMVSLGAADVVLLVGPHGGHRVEQPGGTAAVRQSAHQGAPYAVRR